MTVYEATVEDYRITVYEDGRWKAESDEVLVSYGIGLSAWSAKKQAVEDIQQRIGLIKATKILQDLIWIEHEHTTDS